MSIASMTVPTNESNDSSTSTIQFDLPHSLVTPNAKAMLEDTTEEDDAIEMNYLADEYKKVFFTNVKPINVDQEVQVSSPKTDQESQASVKQSDQEIQTVIEPAAPVVEVQQEPAKDSTQLAQELLTAMEEDDGIEETLDGQVRVVVRVRPPNQLELRSGYLNAIDCSADTKSLQIRSYDGTSRPLTFDKVYDHSVPQERFFNKSGIKQLITRAIEGYSVCVFAFGQSGSGKSFTVSGPEGVMTDHTFGIIPRSFYYLFNEAIHSESLESPLTIRSSFIEIYNEHIFDLLNYNGASLPIRWSAKRGFCVENLCIKNCSDLDDCLSVHKTGLKNRKTAAQRLNDHSSRSHAVLTLYIETEVMDPSTHLPVRRHGKISFVDLAGSERVKDSHAQGDLLKETNMINKSLLTLGKCISCLSDPKKREQHIPYRDSKLTKLLADSLGGNGIALMIACVSPAMLNIGETIKTLDYAKNAKKIKNKVPTVNTNPMEEMLVMLRKEISSLRTANGMLREVISTDPKYKNVLTSTQPQPVLDFKTVSPATKNPKTEPKSVSFEMDMKKTVKATDNDVQSATNSEERVKRDSKMSMSEMGSRSSKVSVSNNSKSNTESKVEVSMKSNERVAVKKATASVSKLPKLAKKSDGHIIKDIKQKAIMDMDDLDAEIARMSN